MSPGRLSRVVSCLLILCHAAQAQLPTSASDEVVALGRELLEAEKTHDRAALERLLDEEVVVIYTSGRIVGRDQHIKTLLARTTMPAEGVRDLVQVTGETALLAERYGEGLRTRVTIIATRKQTSWIIVALQFAALPETAQ